jgi:hypothetical protein
MKITLYHGWAENVCLAVWDGWTKNVLYLYFRSWPLHCKWKGVFLSQMEIWTLSPSIVQGTEYFRPYIANGELQGFHEKWHRAGVLTAADRLVSGLPDIWPHLLWMDWKCKSMLAIEYRLGIGTQHPWLNERWTSDEQLTRSGGHCAWEPVVCETNVSKMVWESRQRHADGWGGVRVW